MSANTDVINNAKALAKRMTVVYDLQQKYEKLKEQEKAAVQKHISIIKDNSKVARTYGRTHKDHPVGLYQKMRMNEINAYNKIQAVRYDRITLKFKLIENQDNLKKFIDSMERYGRGIYPEVLEYMGINGNHIRKLLKAPTD